MSEPEQHHYRCIECQQMAVSERKGRCLCDQCVIDLSQDDGEDVDDEPDDEWGDDCGLMHNGQCSMAGTEHCDFECPSRESELFCGSAAWNRKHEVKT